MRTLHIAVPSEHGAWVFLLSPLLIGLFAGDRWSTPSVYLALAALAAFLARQPLTLAVKAWSGRRSRDVLPAALRWLGIYLVIAALMVVGLVVRGFSYVLLLGLPAAPVLAWHLWLIARRAERRQWLVEIVGSGALALSAPAAYWIGVGRAEPAGWWLWVLTWAQSAASILHAYMRLEQRSLGQAPGWSRRLRMGRPALTVSLANLLVALVLARQGATPPWVFLAYAPQLLESILGVTRPAVGHKPRAIGFRQLAVSSLYTVLFIVLWHVPRGSG